MNEGDPIRSHILSHSQLISNLILHQVEIGSPQWADKIWLAKNMISNEKSDIPHLSTLVEIFASTLDYPDREVFQVAVEGMSLLTLDNKEAAQLVLESCDLLKLLGT